MFSRRERLVFESERESERKAERGRTPTVVVLFVAVVAAVAVAR